MFLRYESEELNNHTIHSNWWLFSDHAPLTITILIVEEYVHNKKCSIIRGSEEEKLFINDLIKVIKLINMSNLTHVQSLENGINSPPNAIDNIWDKNLKIVNITKHLKS